LVIDKINPLYKRDRILVRRAYVVTCEIIVSSSGKKKENDTKKTKHGTSVELRAQNTAVYLRIQEINLINR
jgi:hypothetical protein